jgi:hypothetical protein
MIEILHEVYRFAEEIQGATQQVRTVGEIMATFGRLANLLSRVAITIAVHVITRGIYGAAMME